MNIMKLRKYTWVWFIVALVATANLAKDKSGLIVGTLTALVWMVMANITIRRVSKGLGDWWLTGTILVTAVLGLTVALSGFSVDPVATAAMMTWFVFLMGMYATMEQSMYASSDKEDEQKIQMAVFSYGFYAIFLGSSLLYAWGSRDSILNQFQQCFSPA